MNHVDACTNVVAGEVLTLIYCNTTGENFTSEDS